MAIFRQSLSLDNVDRLNTWAVLFLLLIALVTWLLPLSPVFQAESPLAARANSMTEAEAVHSPTEAVSNTHPRKYKATCWCPAQFTRAHVDYTNAVCESSFNLIMQGGSASEAPADLYEIYGPETTPIDPESTRFKPEIKKVDQEKEGATGTDILKDIDRAMRETMREKREEQKQQQKSEEEANRFFQVTTPFCLFLLAVCLMIPYLVWDLASSLVGGINVDQTLVTANEGSRLDHQSRCQLHTELAQAAAQTAQSCPWKTSCLYLLLKLLVCAAVLSEAIVVHKSLLPQSRVADKAFDKANTAESTTAKSWIEEAANAATGSDKSVIDSQAFSSKTLLCEYDVRILSNAQQYGMQCVFTPVEAKPAPQPVTPEPDHLPQKVSPSTTGQAHMMYECLYLILLTLLVCLAVTNTVNLLVWITKLGCRPCQDSRTSRSQADLPLDGYFLLQMARENAGMDFVRVLAQGDPRRDDKGEGMELAV